MRGWRFGLLVALVAVLVGAGTFAGVVAVLDDGGPDTPPGGDDIEVRDVPGDQRDEGGGETTDATAATDTTAPDAGPTWIAVVASSDSEEEARARAEAAEPVGLPHGVLRSDDHESLNPGLWVAYVGPFATAAEADSAVAALEDAGIAGAYARCVGTKDQCR